MSAEPQFPGHEPEKKSRHLSLVRPLAEDRTSEPVRALVPQAVPKSKRALMYAVFALVPIMLVLILMVNILTAQRQYQLVDLKNQVQTLSQENEALVQEIEYYQAPQDLAVRASQLGLVSTSVQATIDLQSGEITGTPMVASAAEGGSSKNLISPPSLHDTDASATASERAEEQKKQEQEKAAAAAKASASASAAAQATAKASATASAAASPATSANQ